MVQSEPPLRRYGWLLWTVLSFGMGILVSHIGKHVGFLSGIEESPRMRLLSEEAQGDNILSKEEEEEEESTNSIVISVVLILIAFTIFFEITKDHLEERASSTMRPIIEKLFGEMTVLGFLSAVTFILTQNGLFEKLGSSIYGPENSDELLEIFEMAHFMIFFIMVFFCIQVLIVVMEAQQTQDEWLEMDRSVREQEHWTVRARDYHLQERGILSYARLLPGVKHKEEDQVLFKALRDEFILDRDLDYPFAPSRDGVDDSFNFGRYLGICMGGLLTHVVEVRISTWIFFAVATVFYFGVTLLVQQDDKILAWTWVAMAWLLFIYNVHFERHLQMLITAFASRELYRMRGDVENESTNLLERNETEKSHHLPDWCHVDLDRYLQRRPMWTKCLVDGIPNRQQALYWMERKGPPLYVFILQLNLLFVGIYAALQFLHFGPVMFHALSLKLFILYCLLASVPALVIIINKKRLVSLLTPVCCLGSYRRPQVIDKVVREGKTFLGIRSFIIVYRLVRYAAAAGPEPPSHPHVQIPYQDYFDKQDIEQITKTFDDFDVDQNGRISPVEFEKVLARFNADFSQDQVANLVKLLDTDRTGTVEKDEFLQWYANSCQNDTLTLKELSQSMFHMFDADGCGEITVNDFKKRLEKKSIRFSADEVAALVNELDSHNTGNLSEEDFEHLIRKYYPRELKLAEHHEKG